MRALVVLFLLFLNTEVKCQRSFSLDSISGFSCFDTITQLNVWQTTKIYYSDSTLKEDIRFRIWGDGCEVETEKSNENGKCFFKYQRQVYFENHKIEEKEGVYGWYKKGAPKSIYHQMIYNKKGKLLYVQKTKHK